MLYIDIYDGYLDFEYSVSGDFGYSDLRWKMKATYYDAVYFWEAMYDTD